MSVLRLKPTSYTTTLNSGSISNATIFTSSREPEDIASSSSYYATFTSASSGYSGPKIKLNFSAISVSNITKVTLKYRAYQTDGTQGTYYSNGRITLGPTTLVTLGNISSVMTDTNCLSYEIPSEYWDNLTAADWYITIEGGTSGVGSRATYVAPIAVEIEYQGKGSFKIGAKALKKAIFNGLNIKRILQGTTVLFQVGLPDEYQQVAYIGFDGTNSGSSSTPYIDTGIVPSATKGFYLDANITQGASGSSDGANGKTMIRGWSDNTELYWDGDVDKKQPYVVGRHTWTIDYYNHRVGYDTTYDTISNPTTGYATATFFLGAWHEWGAAYYGMAGRVYGFKVYDNGTLIADYIPCYRKSNGVIGFYDMASGTFLTNSGSGALTKGFDVDPTVYQEVEYIESSGTQWIDTGFAHKQSTRFLADIDFDPQSAWVSAFGSWGGTSGSESKFFGAEYNGTGLSAYYYKSSSLYQFPSSCFLGRKIWDLNGRNWNIGGTSHTFSSGSFTSRYTDIIFGNRSYGGSAAAFSRMKLYSFKIYDNGTLIRDFIPCYRVADNEVGLYDIVNNQFYTNQGTGSFTKGNNI